MHATSRSPFLTFVRDGVAVVPGVGRHHLDAAVVVADVAHGRVELDVQALRERHRHARVPIAHCKQTKQDVMRGTRVLLPYGTANNEP